MAHLTDAPGNASGAYVEKDVVAGVDGTVFSAKWGNMVQEEIANAVISQGLALDDGDNTQLAKALSMASGNGPWTNLLLNPYFRVQQRVAVGSGVAQFLLGPASTPTYVADRWIVDADSTVQVLALSNIGEPDGYVDGTNVLGGITGLGHVELEDNAANDQFAASAPQFLRIDGRAGTTAAGSVRIRQIVPNSLAGRGGQVSASIALKTIVAATTLDCVLRIITYESSAFGTVLGTTVQTIASSTLTIDDEFAVFSVAGTLTADTDVRFIEFQIDLLNVDNTTPSIDLTGGNMQIGPLTAGLPVMRPHDLEVMLCQRYFEASNWGALTASGARATVGRGEVGGGTAPLDYPMRVRKRVQNPVGAIYAQSTNTADRCDAIDGNTGTGSVLTVTGVSMEPHLWRNFTFTGTITGSSDLVVLEFRATADAEIYP